MAEEGTPDRLAEHAKLNVAGRMLDELAKSNVIGPVYERVELVDLCVNFLAASNHILLVGEPGTGKNALVESIAMRIAASRVPRGFHWKHVVEVNPAKLIVGCIYVGNLENKLNYLFANARDANAILCIDNLHCSIGSFSNDRDPFSDLATLLAEQCPPPSHVCLIGCTTVEGFKALSKLRPHLAQKFIRVDVPASDQPQTLRMLKSVRPDIEKKHGVRIDLQVPEELVRQLERFHHWRAFPGKAFEWLNRLCTARAAEVDRLGQKLTRTVTVVQFLDALRKETGLPDGILKENVPLRVQDVRAFFRSAIFGQDPAIEEVTRAVLRFKTELSRPDGPVGSFLFAGASGTGKTELAKKLAQFLFGSKDRLLLYPMSQYQGDTGRRRLLGTGSTSISEAVASGGLLDDVRSCPFSVILFDEIDQAGPEILGSLYQILDEGRLVEHTGNVVSFRSSIIIMTTNVGIEHFYKKRIGIGTDRRTDVRRDVDANVRRELETRFGLPFLNRLTGSVVFHPLPQDVIRSIAVKAVLDAQDMLPGLVRRNLRLKLTDAAIDHLVRVGYDEKSGARVMQRAVVTWCIDPVAELLSAAPGLAGTTIGVDFDGGKAVLVPEPKRGLDRG